MLLPPLNTIHRPIEPLPNICRKSSTSSNSIRRSADCSTWKLLRSQSEMFVNSLFIVAKLGIILLFLRIKCKQEITMFTQDDLSQIAAHGLDVRSVEHQMKNFREGFPFLKVVKAAS